MPGWPGWLAFLNGREEGNRIFQEAGQGEEVIAAHPGWQGEGGGVYT